MKLSTAVYFVAASLAAVFGGCSGGTGQPPAATAITQSATFGVVRPRGWMLPGAKSSDLLYASNSTHNMVNVYTYPTGAHVGELKGFPTHTAGLCSDKAGDVYVTTQGYGTNFNLSYVYEYAHGGTEPIATLNDPGFAKGCAVDTVTGNLAVSNLPDSMSGSLAVYQAARGEPTTYSDPNFQGFVFCTYDNVGNLFADGGPENIIDMLPKGGTALTEIQLSQDISSGSIQWWRNRLVIAQVDGSAHGDQSIFDVKIAGSTGTVRGPTLLKSKNGTRAVGSVQFWIKGNTIIGPGHKPPALNGTLEFWKYPKGGLATKVIQANGHPAFVGVTISVDPSSRVRRTKGVK
jgi:hypothetical protein